MSFMLLTDFSHSLTGNMADVPNYFSLQTHDVNFLSAILSAVGFLKTNPAKAISTIQLDITEYGNWVSENHDRSESDFETESCGLVISCDSMYITSISSHGFETFLSKSIDLREFLVKYILNNKKVIKGRFEDFDLINYNA